MNVLETLSALKKVKSLCDCENFTCENLHTLSDLKDELGEKEYADLMTHLKAKVTCPKCNSSENTSTYIVEDTLAAYCRTCLVDMDVDEKGDITILDKEDLPKEPEAKCPTCSRKIDSAYVWFYKEEWSAFCDVCSITFSVESGKVDNDSSDTNIKYHRMTKDKDDIWVCNSCKFETKFDKEVKTHEKLTIGQDPHWTKFVSDKRWQCLYCGEVFTGEFSKAMAHENELGKKLYHSGLNSGYNGTGGSQYQHCTHKPQQVLQAINEEGWTVYAGRRTDCEGYLNNYDIVLNLSGSFVTRNHSIPFPELKMWEYGKTQKFKEIALNWPDMGVLDLPIEFWKNFYSFLKKKGSTRLKEAEKNNAKIQPIKVLAFCIGGHGRTGTAVACLLVVCFGWKADQAIKWVRNNLCSKCIETKSQENYVYEIAGEENPNKVTTETKQMSLPAWMND